MKHKKRRRVVLFLIGLLVTAGGVLAYRLVHGAVARIEAWSGRQLIAIANDHLGPTLHFDELEYRYPKSVRLTNVSFIADDVSIIEAESVFIEFAKLPRSGEPCVIQVAEFDGLVVRFAFDRDDNLIGYKNFVKSGGGRELPDGGSTRTSDFLAVTRIGINDGAIEYDLPDEAPMRLRPLTFEFLRDAASAEDEGGWYSFGADVDLEPLAMLDIAGRLNLDSWDLDVMSAQLRIELDRGKYDAFPPQLQRWLAQHELTGALDWTASGNVPWRDAKATTMDFTVHLADASGVWGERTFPIDDLKLAARMSGGLIDVYDMTITAFGGSTRVWYRLWVDDPQPGRFSGDLDMRGLHLERSFRTPEGEAPKFAGKVDLTLHADGAFSDLESTLTGDGTIALTEGRLVNDSVVKALMKTMAIIPITARHGDRVTTQVALAGDHVAFTDIKAVINALGIRGGGEVFFDQDLDLRLQSGPLERVDGPIANALTSVTGFSTYQVTGTVEHPQVKLKPFGIGMQKGRAGDG